MWRDKDWKNPFCESCWWRHDRQEKYCQHCNCLFEAGADAMLEALEKKNKHFFDYKNWSRFERG